MASAPQLEFFDLETVRLGHFGAIRRINGIGGILDHYYVVGEPVPLPRRRESIAKLVRYHLLEPEPRYQEGVDVSMRLTEKGESIYEEFTRREESGELKKNMLELQEKRRRALEEAYNEYMALKAAGFPSGKE